jgi:small subunit ribosomal protein S4
MSRYLGPRVKVIRRLGPLPGFTNKIWLSKRNTYSNQILIKKKKSQYRVRLEEKQKLRFHYGLTERQLLSYVSIARKAKGSTGLTLLQLLEMRLDNIVFRLRIAMTIPSARQFVNHGHISVNGEIVDIPSYRCQSKDVISIRNCVKSHALVSKSLSHFHKFNIPNHLTLDSDNYKGIVIQLVNRNWIGLKVNELLVMEYYSRQT